MVVPSCASGACILQWAVHAQCAKKAFFASLGSVRLRHEDDCRALLRPLPLHRPSSTGRSDFRAQPVNACLYTETGWLAIRQPKKLIEKVDAGRGGGEALAQLLGVMPERLLAAGDVGSMLGRVLV